MYKIKIDNHSKIRIGNDNYAGITEYSDKFKDIDNTANTENIIISAYNNPTEMRWDDYVEYLKNRADNITTTTTAISQLYDSTGAGKYVFDTVNNSEVYYSSSDKFGILAGLTELYSKANVYPVIIARTADNSTDSYYIYVKIRGIRVYYEKFNISTNFTIFVAPNMILRSGCDWDEIESNFASGTTLYCTNTISFNTATGEPAVSLNQIPETINENEGD